MLKLTDLFSAFLDDVGGEVWQLFEEGVFAPHGLSHHLSQLHGTQCRGQPAVAAQYVHTCLDQPNGLHNIQDTEVSLTEMVHTCSTLEAVVSLRQGKL